MQTRSQRYALQSYKKISRIKAPSEADHKSADFKVPNPKDYGALALNFPVMVLQSGLVQATGFLLAKAKPHHLQFLDDLASVLAEVGTVQLDKAQAPRDAFHQKIVASDLATYQYLTRCTLEASSWFKRYAQAELKASATDGERNG